MFLPVNDVRTCYIVAATCNWLSSGEISDHLTSLCLKQVEYELLTKSYFKQISHVAES
jgi:hypothetical protein